MSGALADTGYPLLMVGSRADGSRRQRHSMSVAYDLLVGDREPDEQPDHLCRNKRCVNPDHLEAVSLAENVMRGESLPARRARSTVCTNGHPWTEETTRVIVRGNGKSYRQCLTCKSFAAAGVV